MANADQKYFVSVEVKWGKQNGEKQEVESSGGQNWGYLSYDQSVAVQNMAVIPGVITMLEKAGEMGLDLISDPVMVEAIKGNSPNR